MRIADHYDKKYAPNTRETIRRQTMHQFCDAGLALYNPDQPDRPVNSPRVVYQIEPSALIVIQAFGTEAWDDLLDAYLANTETLVAQYGVRSGRVLNDTLTPNLSAQAIEIQCFRNFEAAHCISNERLRNSLKVGGRMPLS